MGARVTSPREVPRDPDAAQANCGICHFWRYIAARPITHTHARQHRFTAPPLANPVVRPPATWDRRHVDSFAINRANWDERAVAHAASPGYGLDRFIDDPAHLSDVVTFDLPRLGDIRGLTAVHLQCHIGTDTLSLHRLGARMTGVDFSPPALDEARKLAAATGAQINYVESNLYGAADVLDNESFDLVFTGIGALGWLPDIEGWARVVSRLLKPGGRLFIREGHPMLWAIDEKQVDRLVVGYPYFETVEPLIIDEPGTYVPTDAEFTANVTHEWNHGLGEIITALLGAGMRLDTLVEHDSVPWDALPGFMEAGDDGEYRLREHRERLPLTYTLTATKL
jgi:SAM-dependent methyltransferase